MMCIHSEATEYLSSQAVWSRLHIITGGQTGVDRAALDVALELKLRCGGWCPKGRLAEDGAIAAHYPLQETVSEDPALRTELNAHDSDATLILSVGEPKDGTPLTATCAERYGKPIYTLDLSEELDEKVIEDFRQWVVENEIVLLNVAGPRESHLPGKVYAPAKALLIRLLTHAR